MSELRQKIDLDSNTSYMHEGSWFRSLSYGRTSLGKNASFVVPFRIVMPITGQFEFAAMSLNFGAISNRVVLEEWAGDRCNKNGKGTSDESWKQEKKEHFIIIDLPQFYTAVPPRSSGWSTWFLHSFCHLNNPVRERVVGPAERVVGPAHQDAFSSQWLHGPGSVIARECFFSIFPHRWQLETDTTSLEDAWGKYAALCCTGLLGSKFNETYN